MEANLWKCKNLEDIEIQGNGITVKQAAIAVKNLSSELATPLVEDRRNYAKKTSGVIDKQFVSAKDYFKLIVATAFELTSTDYKHTEGKTLYSEGMYGHLHKYPMLLVEQAFKEHCRKFPTRPTPCHLIRQIEGYEGVWDSINQSRKGQVFSIQESTKFRIKQLQKLIDLTPINGN